MKNFRVQLTAIATGVLLAACGGGGGNGGGNPSLGLFNAPIPPVEKSGFAADGFLNGATICLDLNTNNRCDAGEPSDTTGDGGRDGDFTISATQEQHDSAPLLVVAQAGVTVDTDTGVPISSNFKLTAPIGSDFVSPLTTLVQARIASGQSAAAAEAAVRADLGITVPTSTNYLDNPTNDPALTRLAQVSQVLTAVIANGLAELQASANTSALSETQQLDVVLNSISSNTVSAITAQVGDGTGTPDIAAIATAVDPVDPATVQVAGREVISGTLTQDKTLTNDRIWVLDGVVAVGEGNVQITSEAQAQAIKAAGVTLTIEPGTTVLAESDGVLLVTRGSKLNAAGTAAEPITFASADDNFDGLGEWGGIVIQGFAPQFGAGGTGPCFGTGTLCNVSGEGGTDVAVYGGNDPADDSGVMRFVRIAEGGLVAGPNNEVNGLTLQGVGHGTILEFIQVHGNLDDGIEWFGGTVNLKFAVLTNNDDDSLDYDEGYQGNIQHVIIRMNQDDVAPQGSNDPRGIEANSSDDEFVPETNAAIANVLILGGPLNNVAGGQQPGMRLRGGLTTAIFNSAVKGFDTGCIRIDDADTDVNGVLNFAGVDVQSQVALTNIIGDCADGFYDKRVANTEVNTIATSVTLDTALALTEVEAQLGANTPITPVNNGSGFVFDDTNYIGAVAPGTDQADAWWTGWTIPGSLGEAVPEPGTGGGAITCNGNDCVVSGTITESVTLTADKSWTLDGVVRVGRGNVVVANDADVQAIKAAGVTLTVEPGVNVKARSNGVLLVTRGSKLIAEGTVTKPITFGSEDADFDGLGEWGGIVIQGFAPQFGAGGTGACFGTGTVCNVSGEGGTAVAVYGGNDPADNSGILKFVRITEGGLVAGPNNEVNGLTLQGVGHGTTLEFIQVHGNLDDGIEWFGGTANLKFAVLTNNDDDSLDYDEGYRGNIQHAIIRMSQTATAPQGSNDPRGIEANSSDDEFVPQTNAAIANVLVLGGPINNSAAGKQPGMRLRGGLTTSIFNSAVRDFDTGCIRIDDADTDTNGTIDFQGVDVRSNVSLTNIMADCIDGIYDKRAPAANEESNVFASTITLDSAYAIAEVEARLAAATVITPVDNGSGFVFDSTDYIGAVAPGTSRSAAWWSGWTIPGSLDEDAISFPDFVDCSADGCTASAKISGTVTQDFTLTANLKWVLDGVVRVGAGNVNVANAADVQAIKDAGVTLTIEAGTDVRAEADGILLVTRGSKLNAIGTRFEPITFSSLDDNFDGLGEWGGIVIQGFAPQFGAGGTGPCFGTGTVCNVSGEGGTAVAVYGGNDPADDSGTLRFVRIAEGGLVAGPNNEVNGLTLQGVGHGTTLEFIQVHGNLDDGIEWFGGTVDLKFAVLTNNDDDSLDYDEGYQGNIQYAIIQMNQVVGASPTGSNDPRGIEANSSDDEFVTETNATIANVTIVGGDINNTAGGQQPGMRLRGGLTTAIFNSAIEGFDTGCVRIDDADADKNGVLNFNGVDKQSQVSLTNVLGDCEDGFLDKRAANASTNARASVVTFDDAYAINELDARLAQAPSIPEVANGSLFQFDDTDYIGAVEPGTAAADAWWADWIIPGSLDKVSTPVDDSPAFVTCDFNKTACDIRGTINSDYRMVKGVDWTIDGVVAVGAGNVNVANAAAVTAIKNAGVTLTIEAGVNVDATADAVLLVTRGSKIEARGEADEPITFSSQDAGFDGLGEWGGIVIQGFAPQFGAGGTGACFGTGTVCNVSGEGGTAVAVYGGNDPADDSGSLRYVRITEGGLVAGPNNEVNGLTLQGVGHNTDLQYIQVHGNLDDGIEWFGGTVDLKYAVLTNNDDDSLDYDEGYQGNIQHVLIRMDQTAGASPTGSNDPRGIEANSSDDEFVVETNATIANVTIIGGDINNTAGNQQPGMRLRGGLTTAIFNSAVTGFDTGCIRIDDADADKNGVLDFNGVDKQSVVSLTNVIGSCGAGGFYDKRAANSEDNAAAGSVTLDAAFALTDAAAQLATPVTITPVANGSDFSFDATDYIGAVKPGTTAADNWYSKWVIPGSLD